MWYLAWRYVVYHRGPTSLLVTALALAAYLPVATELLLDRLQRELRSRAAITPLVIGHLGSRTDLTLHALYFRSQVPGTIPYGVVDEVARSGYAVAIPLAAQHTVSRVPLVGTTLDYFPFRGLRVARGQMFGRLGECLVGARAARRLGVEPGDTLLTDTESFVELTQYPLKLHVVGILAAAETPDDDAVFCDVKTVWVVEGIGHGHQDLREVDEEVLLEKKEQEITAGAALKQYLEITPENEASFHFHGNPADFPISAALVVPRDDRAETILLGRWQDHPSWQLVEPPEVVESLLATVFRVKHLLDVAALLVGVSTVLLTVLVILLSLRLRASEMETLFKLGCRRATAARLIAAELIFVATMAAGLLAVLVAISWWAGPSLLRWWLLRTGG